LKKRLHDAEHQRRYFQPISDNTTDFSHTVCAECVKKQYPELDLKLDRR